MPNIRNEYVFKKIDGKMEAVPVEQGEGFTIKTVEARNIGSSSATLVGKLTELNDIAEVSVYFSWLKRGEDPPVYNTNKQTLKSETTFSAEISGLEYKNYTFWADAETSNRKLKGRLKTFSTTS